MFLNARNEYTYGLVVEDLNGFRDITALPVLGRIGPLRMVMTYIPSDFP
jgi:hypothetical protein